MEFRTMVTDPTKDYGYVQRLVLVQRHQPSMDDVDKIVVTMAVENK